MASNVFSMLDDDDTTHEASTNSAAVGALSAAPDALPLSAPVMTPPRHGTSDDTRKREGMFRTKRTPHPSPLNYASMLTVVLYFLTCSARCFNCLLLLFTLTGSDSLHQAGDDRDAHALSSSDVHGFGAAEPGSG